MWSQSPHGLVAGLNAFLMYNNKEKYVFDNQNMIGALAEYISTPKDDFQPMNANFGLFSIEKRFPSKVEKYEFYAKRSLNIIKRI